MKKSLLSGTAVFLSGLFMLGSVGIGFAADKPLVIKANIPTTANAPYGMGIKKFVEAANAKAKSVKFELQLFPSSQLGGTRETVEGIQMGSITMTACSSGFLSGFAPSIAVFDLPYLFRNNEHAYKVMDGPVGDTVKEELLSKGIRLLGFFENGWRHLTNNSRPIKRPEDLKGLKIRVMESPLMVSTLNSMGAIATAMDWSEVITSLKTGVIDGQENVPMNIWNDKTYEVQKYISLKEVNIQDEVDRITHGAGMDIVVELTGNRGVVNEAAKTLRRGGEMVLVGLYSGPVEIDLVNNVIYKEATVYGVTGRIMWDTWWTAQSMLMTGRMDISPVITHRFALADYDQAFVLAESAAAGKILFTI